MIYTVVATHDAILDIPNSILDIHDAIMVI